MAVGTVTCASNVKRSVCLMTAQTANTGAPTDAAAASVSGGVPTYGDATSDIWAASETGAFFVCESPDVATLVISSTAGSGTMVGTFTLWGYLAATGKWYPRAVNADPAVPTVSVALAELASPGDTIRFTQDFYGLGNFDRLYLQLASVGGTATAFEAYLTTARLAGS